MYEHLRLKNSFVLVCFMVILILRIIIEIEVIKKKIKFALSPVKITNTQEMNHFIWWLKYKYQRSFYKKILEKELKNYLYGFRCF